jgi:hypothetical protein
VGQRGGSTRNLLAESPAPSWPRSRRVDCNLPRCVTAVYVAKLQLHPDFNAFHFHMLYRCMHAIACMQMKRSMHFPGSLGVYFLTVNASYSHREGRRRRCEATWGACQKLLAARGVWLKGTPPTVSLRTVTRRRPIRARRSGRRSAAMLLHMKDGPTRIKHLLTGFARRRILTLEKLNGEW